MNTLHFYAPDAGFEMTPTIEEDPFTQSCGDAYAIISVKSNGFMGHNDLWLSSKSFNRFCNSLISLEKSLRGEAILESMSPNELTLKIFSVSSRGNLAIQGSTGYSVLGENGSYWHSIAFGFEFEPQQLGAAVQIPWVRKYGY